MTNNNTPVSEKALRDDERISAYLRGQMDAEQEAAFIRDVEADKELRAVAVSMGYFAKAANEVGEQQDREMKEALMATDEENGRRIAANAIRKPKTIALRRRLTKAVAVAAAVLLLAGVGIHYYDYRLTVGLGNQYASAFTDEQTEWRGEMGEEAAAELTALYDNVRQGKDMPKTIRRLSVLWELSTTETYNDYTNLSPMIGWNLAIALLKDNDADGAREVLQKLVATTKPSSAINKKARELLSKIK